MVREYESTVPSIWSLLLKLLRIISSPSRASHHHLHLHSRRPSLVPHMIPDPTSHILHSTFQDKRLNEPKLHLSCSSHLTPCATPSHVCQRTTDEPSTNTRLHCCLPACLPACLLTSLPLPADAQAAVAILVPAALLGPIPAQSVYSCSQKNTVQ
jgi:hypothetical protein